MKHLIVIFCLCILGSTSAFTEAKVLETQKEKWSSQGWVYSETFGPIQEQAEYVSHLSSTTARSVKAFSSDGKKRSEKELKQTESIYLIVTMANPDGSTGAIIFTKKKPNKAPEPTPTAVMPRAFARVTPSAGSAHL